MSELVLGDYSVLTRVRLEGARITSTRQDAPLRLADCWLIECDLSSLRWDHLVGCKLERCDLPPDGTGVPFGCRVVARDGGERLFA